MLTLNRTALILAVILFTPFLIAQTASIAAPGTQTAVSGGDTITVSGSGWTPSAAVDSGFGSTFEYFDDGTSQLGQVSIDTSGLTIDGSGNLSGTFDLSNPPTGATRIRITVAAGGGAESATSGFLTLAVKPKLIGANISGGVLRLEFDQLMADPAATASASTFTEAQATGATAPDLTGVNIGDVTLDGGNNAFLLVAMSGAATALVQNNTIKVATELLSAAGAATDLVIPAIACTETPSLISAAYDATTNQLTLTFSLVVDQSTVAANLSDLGITDTVSPFSLGSATLDTAGNSTVMQLTLNNANDKTTVNFGTRNATVTSGNIQDTLGNNVGASTGVTISFTADASAPTVTDIRQQGALDTVLITFSDMIDAASVAGAAFPISGRTIDAQTLQSDGKSILVDYDASINTATDFVDVSLVDNNSGLTMVAITSQAIDPLYDADGTVTAGPTTTPTSLDSVTAAAGFVDVFDFRINDGGATDGQPLLVTDITIDMTGTTADNAEHTWRLNGPDLTNLAPTTVNATSLVFSGITISVADSTTEIYTLSVQLHTTPSSTDDNTNDDWAFDVDRTDLTTNPAGSQFTTGAGTAVNDATLYQVTATQLTVASAPTSPTNVGAQISATIHFTDAAGNVDTDNTGTIACGWSEAGAVTNPNEAAVNGIALFDGTTATDFAGPGIMAGTITWSSGGVTSATTTPFHLQAADDADTTIAEGTASPATLSSIAGSTTIFYVDVTDLGTSDTLATIIDEVTFTVAVSGGNDATDFAWVLTDGSTVLSSPTVGATSIAFTGGTAIYTVANGTTKTLQLMATPNATPQSQTDFDNATITLSVANTAFTIDGAGSSLAAGTASNTTNTAVAVIATTFNIFNTAPTGTIAMGAIPTFDVEFVDANGNRDLGVTGDTLTATRAPAGILTGNTATATNGLTTFGALTPGMPGSTSFVLTLTDDVGGLDLSGSPFAHTAFHVQASDDADTTVVEVSTGPATLSSVAGATQIFEIQLADLGTSDGKDTILDSINFNVTISGAHDATAYTWTLHQGAGAVGTPVVNPTDVTISGADFITVTDGTNSALQLQATLNAANSTTIDGSTMDITIAAVDFTEDATSSSIDSTASVDNATNTVLQVTATALNLINNGVTSVNTAQTINHQVEFVDANGNRDLGAGGSEQITVTWNGSATVNNGVLSASSGLVDFNTNVLNMTGVGLLSGILTYTDNASGTLNLSGSPVTENPFNLVSTDDADTALALSGALTEPTTISSLASATQLLDFSITDSGLSDGLDTNLTQVVVNVSGAGDADDGAWTLDNGTDVVGVVGVVAGTIGTQTVTFTVTSAVGDGAAKTYTVSFNPTASPTNTVDNQTFVLSVDETDITLAAGTTLAAGAAVTNGGGCAYTVIATAIAFVSSDTAGVPNTTILAVVEYIDAGGNRDLDVTDTVTVTWTGGGAVNNAALVSIAGLADFDGTQDLNIAPPGVTGGTVTFTDDAAGINLSASPITITSFNLVAADDADVTLSEVGSGPATLSSLAGATAIETVRFTDAGTSDGKTAILDSITFTVTLLNNSGNDATDFDWFLNDGVSDLAADTVTTTTVTFTKAGAGDIITVPNGGTDDVILKANLKTSLSSSSVDGAQFDITVANGGITMDPGGTGLQAAQSVDNGVDTSVAVVATELRVVGSAPTQAAQDTAIVLQVEYTDAQGNRDRDAGAGEQLTATSGDFGAVSNNALSPTVGLVDFQAGSFQFTNPGATAGTITIVDNAGGSLDLSGSPVTVTPFHLIATDDADSTIAEVASASALSSIAALTSVFEFDVTDAGTSDTLPTIINAITFDVAVSGADGADGFIWQLTDGTTPISSSSTTATTVVFTGLSYSTANAGSTSFVLRAATTGSSATIDNATVAIALDKSNITVAGGATSTSFSAGTLSSINDATVGVVATALNISNTLSASYNAGNNITVDVEYVDANGNRDEDVAGGDVLAATRSDSGIIDSGASGSPTTGALSMVINLGFPAATTISLTITDDVAGVSTTPVTSATFDLTADADTTITENTSTASMNSTASFQDVMAVNINDQATVDGLITRVDSMTWDVTFSTGIVATDFTWELFNGASTFTSSAVTANTVSFDNSGSGGLVDAADGASAVLTLRAQVNISDSIILDGTDIQASLDPANVTANAGGSDVTGAAVPSTTDTTVDVIATVIQVEGASPTTVMVGAAIALRVEYVDASGNRDTGVTDIADLSWSGTATATNGSVTAVAGLANFTTAPTSLGMPGALGGTLTVADQAGGTYNFSGAALNFPSFDLVAADDADGTIAESSTAPATLGSLSAYTTIWSMQVSDLGTSDGLDTTITDLIVNVTVSGADDSTAFDWQLTDGTTVEALDSSTGTTLTFNGMSYVASDGGNIVLQLQARVKTATASATLDGDTIAISVADTDVTTTGSSVAGAQTAVNAVDTAIAVIATAFNILTQPSANETGGTGFDVIVEYVDANGNRDTDVSGTETATITRTDSGTVTAGTSAVAAAGIANFTAGNQVILGGPTATATTLLIDNSPMTIAQATSGSVTVDAIAEVTVAAAGGTEATTVSSVAGSVVDVLDFTLTDAGADDADASISQVVVQLGGTADATDGAWTLTGPDHVTPLVGVIGGTVPTQTVTFTTTIGITDGGNEIYVVQFVPTATTLSSTDGQTFTATVAFGAITAAANGSGMTSGSTSNAALAMDVIATEMQFVGTPPATAATGATISTVINYTDVNGNIDTAHVGTITATWSGSGTVANGAVVAASGVSDFGAATLSIGTPGALGGTITFSDSGAFTALTINPFDLISPDDADGTVTANATLTEPTSVASIAGLTQLLDFDVTDLGTSDGLDTNLTQIVVNVSGTGDATDGVWQLDNGTDVVAVAGVAAGTIGSQTVTFTVTSTVTNNSAKTYIVSFNPTASPTNTVDNQTLILSVDDSDITLGAGSTLAAGAPVTNGAGCVYQVTATAFGILTQPPSSISGGSGFDVSVEYVDANGNRDTDVTGPETATLTRTDAGTVTAGTSAVAVSGVANFTAGDQVILGGPTGTATTLLIDSATLTIAQATTTGITVNAIAEVTIATAGGTMATTVSSISGTPVSVVDFKLTDAGVDDADASITEVIVQLSGTADATDGAWTLTGPDHATPLVGVIGGSVPTQTITFTTTIGITDGANEDYLVSFVPTATTLSSTDGQTYIATVAFGAVTAATSGSGMSSSSINNTALAMDVIATEIQFVGTPPATAATGATISTVINYTDVNGNIDTANAGTITATWSGSGTVTNGAVVAASGVTDFGAATLSIGTPGALAGTITFSDSGAFTALTINPFDLISPDDADGTVTVGALTEPASISSLAGATNVLDFTVTDSGISDGKTTDITQIVVNVSGTADANDATWVISGSGIAGTPSATVAGTVGSQTLTWSALTINIADNSAETYLIAVTLSASPAATTDNQNWVLSIADTDITTAGTGSSLATSTAVTNGVGLTFQVTATALAITTQPPASVTGGTGFDVVVEYVDANGNIDVDVADTITALTRSDAGTVSGPSLPLAVASGVASFTGGSQVVIGLPAATAITLTFTDDASGTLASSTVVSTSFNVTDTTPPTISSVALDVGTDITGRTMVVTFSEPVDQTTAETAANYTLQTGAVTPTSATRHATNLNEVTLVFADYAVGGTDTLDVSTVQDVNTNVMVASTGNAITSSDSTAPTLVAISFNDVDASSTVTAGDEYIFTFSEAMNDRPFAAGNTADSLLSPNSSSYGTPNSMVMGEDVGFGSDSRVVIVTIVAGFSANGTETIILGALTDVSGNTVTATSMTLTLTDTVGPRLNSVALDDHDNGGNVTAGDTLLLTFSEQIDPASVPTTNTSGQLDAIFLASGTFGSGATAVFQTGDLVLEIEVAAGVTGVAGAAIDPTATLTDKSSNADITAAPVTIGDGTTDTWGPTTDITYSANPASIGNMTITVNFSDNQTVTPTIAINQPGTNDTGATAMSMGASTRIWTYTYNVIPADGVVNADGTNTVTIVSLAADAQSNAAQAATGTTFVTDTGGPSFASAGVSDPDNFYMSGETISLICNLGETGLTVTADLSVVDSAFGSSVALTDNANNTYSITSAALSSGTLIEGSNLSITLTATDSASNTTTFPVLVTIDNTAPTANLLYNQPSTSVGQGNLVITLQLSEPAGQVPQIAIAGITGTADVTATAMTGSVGDTAFTYTLAVIAGSTGAATVTCTLVNDIAGNAQATIGNNTFTVNATGSPALTADAGADISIALPQIVTLDASSSTGTSLTYAWVQETGPAVTITNGTTSMPTFICQTPDNYTFRVTVTSGASSGSDTVSITLTNCVPEVSAGQRVTLDENEVSGGQTTIGLQGDSIDCNNETLYFVWSLSSGPVGGNLLIDSPTTEASTLSLSTGTTIVPGVYLFQLDVYDPAALISGNPVSDTMAFVVTGTGVNPPASHAGIEQTTEVGTTVTLSSNEASDSDGTLAVFQWSIDSAPTGSTATLSSTTALSPTFTPDVAGIYEIGLRVTDNAGMTSDTVTVTLIVHGSAGANQLPRAVITANHTDTNLDTLINSGESLDLDGSGSVDANGDTLTYQWKQISGPVLIIPDPDAATFTLTPSTSGQYGLELCVNDGTSDGICATYWFQVVAGSVATVSSGSLTAADDPNSDGRILFIPGVGVDNASGNPSVELDGTASTGTGLTHQWRQVQGPTAGLTNAATATASFTPVLSRVYVFELTVTDSSGTVDVSWLTVVIDTYDASVNPGGNAVPESQPVAPASVTPGAVVTLTGAGTDANTPQTSWTWHWVQTDGPPVVLDLTDPQNPTFIPPVAGTYKFLLFIDDGADISTGSSVSIAVAAKGGGGGGGGGGCTASGQGSLPLWILLMMVIPAMYIRRRRQA